MPASIKRPQIITIACIIGFLWVVFSFPSVFSPSIKKLGDWYPALFGLFVASNFISLIGVWHMKRWGVVLYIITFFSKSMLLILIEDTGTATIVSTIIAVLSIAAFLAFYKKMDVNL